MEQRLVEEIRAGVFNNCFSLICINLPDKLTSGKKGMLKSPTQN